MNKTLKIIIVVLLVAAASIITSVIKEGNFKTKLSKQANFLTHIDVSNDISMVKAELNGVEGYFVLDTGASISILSQRYLKVYGVELGHKLDNVGIVGYGGQTIGVYSVGDYSLKLGGIELTSDFVTRKMPVVVNSLEAATGRRIVGIIGMDNIENAGISLDYNTNTVKLWK